MDASLLRWWDGTTWSQQTMSADAAVRPSSDPYAAPTTPDAPAIVPPVLSAVPPLEEAYVPPNSVFRMSESAGGDTYNPEWSDLADISHEVALSGVPVQLSLESTPSEPPIPVSADVFPMLKGEPLNAPEAKAPAWQVEAPLAKPIDQLFPVAAPAAAPVIAPVVAADIFPVAAPAVAPVVAPVVAADVFPVIAPSTAPVADESIPQPAGTAFPGIVPSVAPEPIAPAPVAPVQVAPAPIAPVQAATVQAAPVQAAPVTPAPTLYAEPEAPAPVVAPTPVEPTPVAVAPQPVAPQPVAAQPVAPAPAPVAPDASLYAGPPAVQLGADPVAPADFQPFAASTPGATYVPLQPRPIPQPVQLGAPGPVAGTTVATQANPTQAPPTQAGPSSDSAASLSATPAPTEYWPTQGTPPADAAFQPTPGSYVPFDPSSVHLQPVIPFSSRDPFSSASTARPGMRAYAAAPVGPSGSTWTGGLAFILIAPLLQAAAFFVWTQLTTTAGISLTSATWLPWVWLGIGLFGLAAAQFDRNALARRGYFDLASPFWVLLIPPFVYLVVRATRLHRQGKGSIPAIGLWFLASLAAGAAVVALSYVWVSTPTPERVAFVQTSIQEQLAAKHITATVSCPTVTSFAPGSTFDCTASTDSATVPFRVTVVNWDGQFTVAPLGSGTTSTS